MCSQKMHSNGCNKCDIIRTPWIICACNSKEKFTRYKCDPMVWMVTKTKDIWSPQKKEIWTTNTKRDDFNNWWMNFQCSEHQLEMTIQIEAPRTLQQMDSQSEVHLHNTNSITMFIHGEYWTKTNMPIWLLQECDNFNNKIHKTLSSMFQLMSAWSIQIQGLRNNCPRII